MAAAPSSSSSVLRVRAAVVQAPPSSTHALVLEDLLLDPPHNGEVRVKMKAAGVCHSDWHIASGDSPHSLPCVVGHEGCGVVHDIGPNVSQFKVGDGVILNWSPSCGRCFFCLKGQPSLCEAYCDSIFAGTMFDNTTRFRRPSGQPVYHYTALGCFSDFVVVPEVCCVKLPEGMPYACGALIGCAVSTGIGATIRTVDVKAGDSVVVFGCGGVGLSAILGARLVGANPIIAVDTSAKKKDISKSLGATHFILAFADQHENPSEGSTVKEIRNLTKGKGADFSFECVGIPVTQELCVESIRRGGTAVLAGLAPSNTSFALSGAALTRTAKRIVGCYYGDTLPARDFALFADLYMNKKLDLDALITRTYPLELVNEAFRDMLQGEVARGIIQFD